MITFEQAKERLDETLRNLHVSKSKGLPTDQIIKETIENLKQDIRQEDKWKFDELLRNRRLL